MRLSSFSDDELIEELARRRNARERNTTIERFCEDCTHFRLFTGRGDPPVNYDPCSRGHKPSFRAPAEYGDEYGFYRRVCADRAEAPCTNSNS